MAMQVPTFTDAMSQVKPDQMPTERVTTQAPADAFGGSFAKSGEAAVGAMGQAVSAMKEEQDRADQLVHIQADTQASQLQTKIQTDVAKMKGQNAFQAPDYMQKQWQEGVSQIQDSLTNGNQRMAFAKTSSQRFEDLNKSVQVHVASESENFADQTFQGGMDQARNAAVINAGDDHQVEQNLGIQRQLMEGWAQRKGILLDSDIFKQKVTAETSATNLGVVHARLQSGLDDAAQKYFDAHKDTMSAQDIAQAENVLDASKVVGESNDLFNDVMNKKGFKYSDGSVNGEAVRKYVMSETDGEMSDQRAIKVLGQVKAQVAEYNRDRYHQISANERDFANQVIKSRQNGMELQDALKQATQWGHDAYDIAQKQAFIQKTYEPPAETKAVAHEQLKEGIQTGTVELDDLDRAMNKGDINAQDWANLRQLKLKTAADGTDPQSKYTDGLIKQMAQKNFGNDKEARAQFQYVLGQKAQGKSPDEKLAVAQEELKKVPNPDSWFWGSMSKSKQDFKALQSQSTAQGAMYEDVGYKQAQAIANGMQGGGFQRSPNPEANLQAFANTLGVKYEDMKIGSPANNAVVSLQAKGKLVTPQAVQRLLEKYPDGHWR